MDDLKELDWKSIDATEWTDDNLDNDTDRMRKKQSEFLIKDYMPTTFINSILVYNTDIKTKIEKLIKKYNLNIAVLIDNSSKFYY